jgi:hypothetical protein
MKMKAIREWWRPIDDFLVRPEHLALAPDAIDWRPIKERNQ